MAKATDGLAFGITRHCRIEGLPPVPPTPSLPGGGGSVAGNLMWCDSRPAALKTPKNTIYIALKTAKRRSCTSTKTA